MMAMPVNMALVTYVSCGSYFSAVEQCLHMILASVM